MFSVSNAMSQTMFGSVVDGGNVSLNLSAWLEGYRSQDDSARVSVDFFNGFHQIIGNRSSMVSFNTRYVTGIVTFLRFGTSDHDGNADNSAL
jgi:hypothetical protein